MFITNIKTILIILLLVAILLVLGFLLVRPKRDLSPLPKSVPVFSPSPSASPSIGPLPGHSYTYSSDEDVAQRRRGEAVAQLIKKLPYNGADFSLQYSFEKNTFIVTLDKNNTPAANAEFDKFLNENGIENRDWLYNLEVIK